MKFSQYNLAVPRPNGCESIVFNTLSGHSFIVSDDVQIALQNGHLSELEKETFDQFVKYGLIVPDEVDETRYFDYYYNRSKFSSNHISSTVLLTWACNLACVYCFEGAGAIKESMTQEMADRYIKFMTTQAEGRNSKSMSVNLFGGEPLVNINRGFYILEGLQAYCSKNNLTLSCGMITNGTLLTEEILDKLELFNCTSIQVTLDGMQETHDKRRLYKTGAGSFNDVIAGIKKLAARSNKFATVIRINVDKANIEEAYTLLKHLGRNGEKLNNCAVDFGIVRGSTLACSAYSGNCFSDSEIGDILDSLWSAAAAEGFSVNTRPIKKWMYCGVYADNQFTVTPTCGVYKCWEHAGMDEHLMGQIGENGQLENMKYPFFDWMSKNPLEVDECKTCVYLPACGGGCVVVSYNETGSYHKQGCFKIKGVLEKQVLRYIQSVEATRV